MNQSVYDSMDYLPFGEQIAGDTGTTRKFTGYERDSESDNDDASARHMSSSLGRFLSPDPLGGDVSDPQSLNGCSYVGNNPTSFSDPSGLFRTPWGFGGTDFGFGWNWNEFYWTSEPIIIGYTNLSGEPEPVWGVPLGLLAGAPHSPAGPHVNVKVLADCVSGRFGVSLTSFTPSAPGQNGSFTGYGPDIVNNGGNNATLTVTNDINRYSSSQLEAESQLAGNPPSPPGTYTLGLTFDSSPSLNFTANNILQLGFSSLRILQTQVHELGNSLELFTGAANGDPGSHGDNDAGQKLEDCVRRNHGFIVH